GKSPRDNVLHYYVHDALFDLVKEGRGTIRLPDNPLSRGSNTRTNTASTLGNFGGPRTWRPANCQPSLVLRDEVDWSRWSLKVVVVVFRSVVTLVTVLLGEFTDRWDFGGPDAAVLALSVFAVLLEIELHLQPLFALSSETGLVIVGGRNVGLWIGEGICLNGRDWSVGVEKSVVSAHVGGNGFVVGGSKFVGSGGRTC
ncbi:uncharacterized protein LY89DRAFT_755152, partial [Mollisia scopiformis]